MLRSNNSLRCEAGELFESNIETACLVHQQAGPRTGETVILIVDFTDGPGRVLAEGLCGVDHVGSLVHEHQHRGEVPTMVIAVPRDEVRAQAMAALSPSGGEFVRRGIPEGHFGVVTIARGGNLFTALASRE